MRPPNADTYSTHQPVALIIGRLFPPARGSTGRLARDLARRLSADGWAVHVLAGQAAAQGNGGSEEAGAIHIRRVKSPARMRRIWPYLLCWWRLRRAALKGPRPDLVITLSDPPLTALIGRRVAQKTGAAHLHWSHDVYPDLLPILGVGLPPGLRRRLHKAARRAFNDSAGVVTVGRCMAGYLARTGVRPDKITLIPNWPEQEIITPPPAESLRVLNGTEDGSAAACHPLSRDQRPRFRVLYAGNIGRAHPVRPILSAAELLAEREDIEILFIGDGPNHDRLAEERARRHLDNLKLLPYQPLECLRDAMISGDLHLVTLRDAACGMMVPAKFYAALATARPVIFAGPEGSEVARVIADFNCGAVVPPGNPEALAGAILYFRENEAAWFEAQKGAWAAHRHFSAANALDNWAALARHVTGRGG